MDIVPIENPGDSYEPVWTCQGVLRFPQRFYVEGDYEEFGGEDPQRWAVPDCEKWYQVPGFPDFLVDPSKANQAFVRLMTNEERESYHRGKAERNGQHREMRLVLRMESLSIEVNGSVVFLSPREHELLVRTIEESPLSHKRAVQFLEAVKSKSPGAVEGFVDSRALADHRKGILAKVERDAGRQARILLGEAFGSRSGEFVYDSGALPVQSEKRA